VDFSTQLNFIDERVKTTTDIVIKINKLSYNKTDTTIKATRNVASAQRDGRPAEYRWRSLFNVATFG